MGSRVAVVASRETEVVKDVAGAMVAAAVMDKVAAS